MSLIWGWNPTELSFGLGADPLSNRRLPVSVRGWVAGRLSCAYSVQCGSFRYGAHPRRSLNALERSHRGREAFYGPHDGLDRRFEKAMIFQFPKAMLYLVL